jgi:hypothetical protein
MADGSYIFAGNGSGFNNISVVTAITSRACNKVKNKHRSIVIQRKFSHGDNL